MSLESLLFLALVIGALSVFTATLSYGQWVTRNVVQDAISAAAKSLKVSRKPTIVRSRNATRAYEEVL